MAKRKYVDGLAMSTDNSDVESSLEPEFKVLLINRGDAESSPRAEYEVFLNFKGLDTCLNFIDCLYHAMDEAGIRVFRDDEEIRKGEAIEGKLERAIKISTICISIFSKNYASSVWCLRELAYMMDCKAMILPIFFDVEPRDVKLKSEPYWTLYKSMKRNWVVRWCSDGRILKQVAHMKGWISKIPGKV
ncbi:toll/interleukin-1 receptor-like protein [Eucalyptus grandis]|uniref:toll/interleukin-1 receptor-like protein n=1 Tax=Eucalyptus grandis TaxID=71139 RepID=UPI00192E878E|nr:toll/interleukin-1 receptor-like protein [Eucalyptus grandis]